MTALKCTVQLAYWFDDYYRDNLKNSCISDRIGDRSVDEILHDIDRQVARESRGFWGRLFS